MHLTDNRYKRQELMPFFTKNRENRFAQTNVAVVGCGGLGSLNILYLAALSIGKLTLIDNDKVELSNLNRQIIHNEIDIGNYKVDSASQKVKLLNDTVKIKKAYVYLQRNNCENILSNVDLIIDAVDNISTRYILDNYSSQHNIPIIFAGVEGFHGFIYAKPSSSFPSYANIFPSKKQSATKQPVGVYGAGVGLVSCIECNEAIKLISSKSTPFAHLISVNLLNDSFSLLNLKEYKQ